MLTPSIIRAKQRVLVGTPHSDIKNYCLEDFIARMHTLTYSNYDVLVVDNSQTKKNYKRFIKEGFKCIHVKPRNHSIQKLLALSHEAIRDYAVRNGYDWLLHYESDIISPPDVIQRLMIHNKPIVSAMYMINFGSDSHLMAQKMEDFGSLRETITVKEGSDLLMVDGTLKKVFACGLGCVLLRKDILDKFKFRHEKGASIHPDSFFAFDTDAIGIPKFIDTSVLCDHKNSEWIYS